jgi:ABC-type multidrug transport system ATPase subunit
MLQRLALAQALLTDPDLLILDEPTARLDPLSQYEVHQLLVELHAAGKASVLCSHCRAEVEVRCDAVAILRRGRLVSDGSVATLVQGEDVVEIALAGGAFVAADAPIHSLNPISRALVLFLGECVGHAEPRTGVVPALPSVR